MDTAIIRCESDSPHRCQGIGAQGSQCLNQAMIIAEGRFAKYCSMHGGVAEAKKEESRSKDMYRLAKWGSRIGSLSEHSQVKGLRNEIGILRMVLEERLNKCNDNDELMLASNVISDLVSKIERVVTSCHKLEASMGQLLDKQQIIVFAESIIKVISESVTDPALLELLATKIGEATEQTLTIVERQHDEGKPTNVRLSDLDG